MGTVSLDDTKVDADASKIKSVRYDRIQTLRAKLDSDIAQLVAKAEAADQEPGDDGLSLPEEIARRQGLKAKLDAAARTPDQSDGPRQCHHAQIGPSRIPPGL